MPIDNTRAEDAHPPLRYRPQLSAVGNYVGYAVGVAARPTANLPGLRYHKYKGTKATIHSLDLSGNDRILFTFDKDSNKYTCIYYGDPHGKQF